MSIKNWIEEDRPREKMLARGDESLTDSELLAILLRNGTQGKSAIDIARELINEYKSMTELSKVPVSQLMKLKGIGRAKAITLAAAFGVGKRIEAGKPLTNEVFDGPDKIARYYGAKLRDKKKEEFWVLMLNSSNKVFKEEKVTEGILNSSLVHPREIFRSAILESAASIILLHNHPSGSKEPSREDILITKQLADAGSILQIRVHDHIIIAGMDYTSMKVLGYII